MPEYEKLTDSPITAMARIAYIPNHGGGTMITGLILDHAIGDGKLWEMVDCDIIIVPKKRYVQASTQSHSLNFVREVLGMGEHWTEVQDA